MQLGASNVSKDAFISYFMTILPYGALARVFTCDTSLDKYFEKINYMFSQDIPCALAIKYLEMLVHNQDIEINENLELSNDSLSQIIKCFIVAFKQFDGDYNSFAQNIYQVKLLARKFKDSFWGLLSDLLIGYSYQKLGSTVKANVIFKDVQTIAQKSGMGYVSVWANWFVANLNYDKHEYELASKNIGDNIIVISRSSADDMLPAILSYILQINIVVAQQTCDTDLQPILYKINYGCERFNLQYMQSMLVEYESYIEGYKAKVEAMNNEFNNQNENAETENLETFEEDNTSSN